MSNNLQVITDNLRAPEVIGRTMLALGYSDSKDQAGIAEAKRYAGSVIMEIEKSAVANAGDPKKNLATCSPHSIVQAMIDSARLKTQIDGRQLAHLVRYGDNVVFQMGYRGYIYKVKEAYQDADISAELIFEGDDLTVWSESGVDQYTLKKKDPFATNEAQFKGVMVVVTYTDHGRPCRKVALIPKIRIDRARGAAKQDYIWKSDYFEKAKAAAIKSAFKIMFASLQGLQDAIRFDNENHFDVNKAITGERPVTIIDNMNNALQEDGGQLVEDQVTPATPEPKPEDQTARLENLADKIRAAIKAEPTPQGIDELWDLDFRNELQEIQEFVPATYNFLVVSRDEQKKRLEGGAA